MEYKNRIEMLHEIISCGVSILHLISFYIAILKPLIKKGRRLKPQRSDILIWDVSGSEFLSDHVLEGIDHTILHTRDEFYYIIPYIRTVFRILFQMSKGDANDENNSDFSILYLETCIGHINPRVVITFIDNDFRFHQIASRHLGASFYSIQNGSRVMNDLVEYTLKEFEMIYLMDVSLNLTPNYLCFGKCEEIFYKKYGAAIKSYHPVGALKGSWYYYSKPRSMLTQQFTLCLVSQYRPVDPVPIIQSCLATLEEFLQRFINETGVSACIATASSSDEEYRHFYKIFGNTATILRNNQHTFTTYQAMEKSVVIVNFCSTAALEAFGWGKKVLFCNYTREPIWGYDFSEICCTNLPEYSCFREKLLRLIGMSEADYQRDTLHHQKHYMNYDQEVPATAYLRSLIEKDLQSHS
jgi:hypothetical protein